MSFCVALCMCLCVCVRECARGLALAHKLTHAREHTHSLTHTHTLALTHDGVVDAAAAAACWSASSHPKSQPSAANGSHSQHISSLESGRLVSSVLSVAERVYHPQKLPVCASVCVCVPFVLVSTRRERETRNTRTNNVHTHTHTTDKKHREPLFVLVAYVCECVCLQRDDGYIIAATSCITRVDQ